MSAAKAEVRPMGQAGAVRVCIVEDDTLVRQQLVEQLKAASGFLCVGNYPSAESALEGIPREKPDVVLMDINLPKMSGIDCVRQLKGALPGTQYLMLTVYEDADAIFKSLLAGAVGYLLKGRSESGEGVLEALREAASGGSRLNSLMARKIVQHFHHQPARPGSEHGLSSREREVLELLSKGLPDKEIADTLGVSLETIRKYCHSMYEKLQASAQAAQPGDPGADRARA